MTDRIPDRLMDSAAQLFLEKDFHGVRIRELAERANTTSGMIKYYFENKHGLFEAMIQREYGKMLAILQDIIEQEGLIDFTEIINRVMAVFDGNPNMPKFIIKTYLLRQGPGSQFITRSFETERKLVHDWVQRVIGEGKIDRNTDAEVVRIAFMSLTLLPGMMTDIFRDSYGEQGHHDFRNRYAEFVGDMLIQALKPKSSKAAPSQSGAE